MKKGTIRITATLLICAAGSAACGGGGGGGGSGNGETPTSTYSTALTGVELTDTRTGQAVNASGLPIQGATVTRD